MAKYLVTGIISASMTIGTYEADSEDEAIAMADKDTAANWRPSLCHQCSHEIDLGDIYETVAEVIE